MIDRTILKAVEAAQIELSLYLLSGPHSAEQTVERLVHILNSREVVQAIDDIGRPGNVTPLKLVKSGPAIEHKTEPGARRDETA